MKKIPKFKSGKEERDFWGKHSFLDFPAEIEEIEPIPVDLKLKSDILTGKRKRRKVNISIRFDPAELSTIKKVSTQKSVPYQNLIRMWVVENLKKELQ